VEHGGSGRRVAAPIARKIIDHYLGRKGGKGGKDGLLLTSADRSAARAAPLRGRVSRGR